MIKRHYAIEHIPATLWGEDRGGPLYLAVHGDMSHKEDTVIDMLAQRVVAAGGRVLSFDLPEHGDRKNEGTACTIQTCVPDLKTVMRHARGLSSDIGLFACSMGAYFSLVAFAGESLRQCLFLSPVTDMRLLIEAMMEWFSVSTERLRAEGEIPTPIGKTLSWEYYSYVLAHPVETWPHPTAVLYGEKDAVCRFDWVSEFCRRFHGELTVMRDGEHFFHTGEQLAFFQGWLEEKLRGAENREPLF
jgi:pimeloyl-ACP methyl ester carboxylesterase